MNPTLTQHTPALNPTVASRTLRLLARLPNSWLFNIGKTLGMASYYVGTHRRHIADVNVRLCFPQLTKKQRKQLVWQHFISTGLGVTEAIIGWCKPSHQLPRLEIRGIEHVEQACARGKGVILLSAHFTSLELVGRLLSQAMDFAVIYRKQKNRAVNDLMCSARHSIYARAIDRDDARGIFRALKDNIPIWLAADQDYGRKRSTFALFFGLPAAFIMSPSRLAGKTGAAVIPSHFYRLANGQGYCMEFAPPIDGFDQHDADTNAKLTSEFIEQAIERHPEQYLWIHRRFKTRPEGKARYYQ